MLIKSKNRHLAQTLLTLHSQDPRAMIRPLPLIAPLAMLSLTGCLYGYWASTTATPLGTAPLHPLLPPDSIALYFGPTLFSDTAYVSVAFIEVQGGSSDGNQTLIAKARKKAAELNANAIINIEFGQTLRRRGEMMSEMIGDVHNATDGDPDTHALQRDEYTAMVLRGVAVYIKPRELADGR
jgi:hypothetical protein